MFQVAKNGVPLPQDRSLCPLCCQKRANPSVLTVSGFVFCYSCIFKSVSQVSMSVLSFFSCLLEQVMLDRKVWVFCSLVVRVKNHFSIFGLKYYSNIFLKWLFNFLSVFLKCTWFVSVQKMPPLLTQAPMSTLPSAMIPPFLRLMVENTWDLRKQTNLKNKNISIWIYLALFLWNGDIFFFQSIRSNVYFLQIVMNSGVYFICNSKCADALHNHYIILYFLIFFFVLFCFPLSSTKNVPCL